MHLDVRVGDDPIEALRRWYDEACATLPRDEAHRIALATASEEGMPSVRIVLCRAIDEAGRLVFYTNYESDKGRELAANPRAAVVFHWASRGRQLRVKGSVAQTASSVSDAYWASRPRESQRSALCSPQSRAIECFDVLATCREAIDRELGDALVPRPAHWGGYALTPEAIEFWQEGQARFHERIRFVAHDSGWAGELLAA